MNVREEQVAHFILSTALLAGLMAVGCGPKMNHELTCEDHYNIGRAALEAGHYIDAVESFETITLNFPGCEVVDDAQFMLGEAYYGKEDFITASFEYQRVVEDFPLSSMVEEAKFKIAGCNAEEILPSAKDQASTHDAIFYFRQYLQDYPAGQFSDDARKSILELRSRLANKLLNTANFYLRLGYYESCIVYVDEVVKRYPESDQAQRAQLLRVRALDGQKKPTEALEELGRLSRDSLSDDELETADELKVELEAAGQPEESDRGSGSGDQ